MRAKNEVILARNGEERINSTSRENLEFTRIFDDLEQVHRRVWELLLSGRSEVRILSETPKTPAGLKRPAGVFSCQLPLVILIFTISQLVPTRMGIPHVPTPEETIT